MPHQHIPACFAVKDGIHGLGIFTTDDIKKGEVLFQMEGEILDTPTRTSIEIGTNKHIEDAIGAHINHSCKPNIRINRENHSVISLEDIKAGQEIMFDYTKNETSMAAPFKCECCGQMISGLTTNKSVL